MNNREAYDACLLWLQKRGSWSAYNAMNDDGYDASCDYKSMLAKWQGEPAESVSPAPQPAGNCAKCGTAVYHREGKPGEYDHVCKPVAAPQEVKRYQPQCWLPSVPDDGTGVVEHPRGLYVLHSAYVSLREELDKANRNLGAYRQAVQRGEEDYIDADGLLRCFIDEQERLNGVVADMRKALHVMLCEAKASQEILKCEVCSGLETEIAALLSEVKP